jgi:hypothetical protein
LPEEQWAVRSQVLSLKRTDLQKVEGRKLFEKMRPARLEELPVRSEQEVTAALRNRVAGLEQACVDLGRRVGEKEDEMQ